jgi:2-dehydropantoate 2-reductase
MQDTMNWLVYGAGAIGTYIGGSLALQDHRVAFIEKVKVARKISRRGLCLEIDGKQNQIPDPEIWTSTKKALEKGPFNVVIFALKCFDTEPALKTIAPHADQLPPFLCLQNGVENEDRLVDVLGTDKVIAGTVTSAIGRHDAGDVILERQRGMGIAAEHPLSSDILTALESAGINARLYAHAADMKWSKLLTNLLANASSAILDMTPKDIFEHPRLFRLEIAQLRETLAVMDAHHIQVVDLPETPVRALSLAVRNLPATISRPLLQSSLAKGRGGKMPSFHIDLRSGKSNSEVDWMNGAVVRFGEVIGVPTPVNRALNETLLAMIAGRIPLDKFAKQPDRLMALVGLD